MNIIILHINNCAHRDIKLENFLINLKDCRIKFADFGISEIYTKRKDLYCLCGTSRYLSSDLNKLMKEQENS